ncbi:phosphoprotein phosphatase [Tritrichomonas foetus]|uniref:Phosphoprotein phosphatase n=1 Tax=Tritrichomonas foetus TaxID=1144522 RepID=A0A1J4KVT2_9EUKA|nr:phosphoprotein phosphatase [Tritrichomonas foetus]|eukprot:OHT15000.1 phosphoprotein phosphatase [Tritrichomonas foetus]
MRRRIITPQRRHQNSASSSSKPTRPSNKPVVLASLPPKPKTKDLPKVEPGLKLDKTVTFSSHCTYSCDDVDIVMSKIFSEIPPKDARIIFIQKCNECSKICDFSSDKKDVKAKPIKSSLLRHLIQCFSIPHISRSLTPEAVNAFFQMIAKNIFRPFPIFKHEGPSDAKDSIQDAAWPHISLVYECLLTSFSSPSINDFPSTFLSNIVDNSLSPDERERKEAKKVLQNLYNKFPSTRMTIRQRCSYLFSSSRCSSDLLEFFYTVVSGFTPPLKSDNIDMFNRIILPLHCLNNYHTFQRSLVPVIARFIAKSDNLLQNALDYLNKHWPCTDRNKQSMFLKEYEELVITFDNRMTQPMALQFFRKINECIGNEHTVVACASLEILQNTKLNHFIKSNASSLYFMLIMTITNVLKEHWDDDTRDMSAATLDVLNETEPNAYKKAVEMQKMVKSKKTAAFGVCKTTWKKVLDAAKTNYVSLSNLQIEDLNFLR